MTSVDSALIGGNYRKAFLLSGNFIFASIIEGMGNSDATPLWPLGGPNLAGAEYLKCFQGNGQLQFAYMGYCDCSDLVTVGEINSNAVFSISPTPHPTTFSSISRAGLQ